MSSPFFYYNARFDAEATIRRHAVGGLKSTPGMLTNYLGVRIDPKFLPSILTNMAGVVEPVPIPANWHADIAEWAAALRAVELARGAFKVVELGCGWGCWLNNTGVAARTLGLEVTLIGVEGDEGHIQFAREACATNGFRPDQVTLHRGIAAGTGGVALFPRQAKAGLHWGLEPIFGASRGQQDKARSKGTHDILPMVAIEEIVRSGTKTDLLHIDIQGGEADLIASSLAALKKYVGYIVIGTHSREIEGALFKSLLADGWILEIERPAILGVENPVPYVKVDGVQGWRNPRLLP